MDVDVRLTGEKKKPPDPAFPQVRGLVYRQRGRDSNQDMFTLRAPFYAQVGRVQVSSQPFRIVDVLTRQQY